MSELTDNIKHLLDRDVAPKDIAEQLGCSIFTVYKHTRGRDIVKKRQLTPQQVRVKLRTRSMAALAKELGVSRQTLHNWLRGN